MGVYHEVNFICPHCDAVIEVQSKALDGMEWHSEDEVPNAIALAIEGTRVRCLVCDRSYTVARLTNPSTVKMRLVS